MPLKKMKLNSSPSLRLFLMLLFFDLWKSAWAMAPLSSAPPTTSLPPDGMSRRDGSIVSDARIVKKRRRRKSKRQRSGIHSTNPNDLADQEPMHEVNQLVTRSARKSRRRKSTNDFAASKHSTKSSNESISPVETKGYAKIEALECTTRSALEESKYQVEQNQLHMKEGDALPVIAISKNDGSVTSLLPNGKFKSPSTRRRKRRKMNAASETPKDIHPTIDKESLIPIIEDEVDDVVNDDDFGDENHNKTVTYHEKNFDYPIESGLVHDNQSYSLNDTEPSPELTISRNETMETFTIQDESHPEEPIKLESTKYRQEEKIHSTIHFDESGNVATSPADFPNEAKTRTLATTVKSSEEEENVQISSRNGNNNQAFIMNISRTRKEQSLHIKRPIATGVKQNTKSNDQKISSRQKPKKATKPTSSSASRGGKGGECLRRIKREWKDAVQMGIAYDWNSMRTLHSSSSLSPGASTGTGGNNHDYVRIGPFGKNLLRWHFSVQGPANSVYEEGVYHGRVLLPKDYPGSPPRIQMLTPSGRFIPGEDICLSASNYHPETWTPQWTILSLVDALRIHMLTMANEIGGVMASDDKRRQLATESRSWGYPGVVDHRRMIEDGIFPWMKDDNASGHADEVPDGSKDVETADIRAAERALTKKNKKRGVIDSAKQRSNDCETMSLLQDQIVDEEEKYKKPVKVSKSSKQQKKETDFGGDQMKSRNKPKTAVIQSKSRGKTVNATSAKGPKNSRGGNAEMQNDVKERGLSKSKLVPFPLTKYLIVEMIKLPLRVVSVLLRVLTVLESRLRSLLDSL